MIFSSYVAIGIIRWKNNPKCKTCHQQLLVNKTCNNHDIWYTFFDLAFLLENCCFFKKVNCTTCYRHKKFNKWLKINCYMSLAIYTQWNVQSSKQKSKLILSWGLFFGFWECWSKDENMAQIVTKYKEKSCGTTNYFPTKSQYFAHRHNFNFPRCGYQKVTNQVSNNLNVLIHRTKLEITSSDFYVFIYLFF